ncbi:sugar transferase [bacterium]|nr:sugar transferase [bacterium]
MNGFQDENSAKRILDIILSSLFVILFLPLMLIISLLIIVKDGRPVFYRSRRIGINGISFNMLKFRTMHLNNDEFLDTNQKDLFRTNFKLDNDPRVTPFGMVLRKTNLDELPQLFNVIKGDMSLVGPRPKLPEELYLYGNDVHQLLSIPPGITGYWQVFRQNANSDKVMRRLDMFYVQHHTLLLDTLILLITPRSLINRRSW